MERIVSKMIKTSKEKVNRNSSLSGWEAAIEHAKEELNSAKFRVTQLKAAIRMLNEHRDLGDSWPSWAETNDSHNKDLS